jgi:hypothetical protein
MPSVKSALKEIKEKTVFYKELGSYPLFQKLGLPADKLDSNLNNS